MEKFSVEITRCSRRIKYEKNVAFGNFLNLYKLFFFQNVIGLKIS